MHKTTHKAFLLLYTVGLIVFGGLFLRHMGHVGQDYVLENWLIYVFMWAGGTSFWGLFYAFALFTEEVLNDS